MFKLVIFSRSDIAGENIGKILVDKYKFNEVNEKLHRKDDLLLMQIDSEIMYLTEFNLKPEVCIVASKHSSESKMPCLTLHSTGNFSIAELGGNSKELGISPALYISTALKNLKKNSTHVECEICLEATHHGPTQLDFPIMFIEVGSSLNEWKNLNLCEIIADTIYETLTEKPEKKDVAIGFGGGHYCRKFSQIENFALGHICAKYNLCNVDGKIIHEMIKKTIPSPEYALIEKKGMGKEKKRILELLEKTNLEIKFI
ncbi:MAG: D-aminoacyl-tRNA deacylase [Candidatus Altiarchaeota archaeon]